MDIRSDSTALITGAASGFGAAVARRLSAEGARMVLADVDETGGRAVAQEVGGLFVRCDVRNPQDSVQAVAAAEQEYGRLDIAFLNAGVASKEGRLAEIPLEEYTRVVEINLGGVYFGAQAALPALRRAGGGAIVATASLAGLIPMGIDPLYTLTKHAVVGLVRSLADQFQDEGITVNAICPGFAETDLLAASIAAITAKTGRSDAEARAALANPQGRFVNPEEVAAAVLWLASDAARSVTGQALSISGGETW